MTRVTTTPLAVSADYADALLAARRAKNWLFLLLLIGLLAQITIFFLAHFKVIQLGARTDDTTISTPNVDVDVNVTTRPTTEPDGDRGTDTDVNASVTTQPASESKLVVGGKDVTGGLIAWVVNSIVYLGTILSIVLCVVILLLVLTMLVGRLLGAAHTTSAFIWSAVLFALLFPWQLFHGPETAPATSAQGTSVSARDDFRVPGVLYTWGELRRDANFSSQPLGNAVLKWARFAGFPILALIILFMVQAKSGRGVKYALGEAEVHVDVATTDTDLR